MPLFQLFQLRAALADQLKIRRVFGNQPAKLRFARFRRRNFFFQPRDAFPPLRLFRTPLPGVPRRLRRFLRCGLGGFLPRALFFQLFYLPVFVKCALEFIQLAIRYFINPFRERVDEISVVRPNRSTGKTR